MVKSFLYGLVVGIIITGILWSLIGRNDTGEIRKDYERASADLERVHRVVSKLSTDSDGFTGDLVEVTESIKQAEERVGLSNERLSESNGTVREQLVKVEQLEKWNRRTIVLSRDFADQLYELRQLNKESRN